MNEAQTQKQLEFLESRNILYSINKEYWISPQFKKSLAQTFGNNKNADESLVIEIINYVGNATREDLVNYVGILEAFIDMQKFREMKVL